MPVSLSERIDALFDQMIEQQRAKVLRIAREINPTITPDDVLNPHDFPDLNVDAQYNFEDGILSGYIGAQMAVRAEMASLAHASESREVG
ncbi:MAG TPA: hypothetical protein V6D00_00170 [Pantanalinema sp.]